MLEERVPRQCDLDSSNHEFIESWTALFGKWKALPALSCALSNSSRYNINEYIPPLKIMFTLTHFNLYSIKFVVMLGSPQYKHKGKWKTPFKVIVKIQFLKHFHGLETVVFCLWRENHLRMINNIDQNLDFAWWIVQFPYMSFTERREIYFFIWVTEMKC